MYATCHILTVSWDSGCAPCSPLTRRRREERNRSAVAHSGPLWLYQQFCLDRRHFQRDCQTWMCRGSPSSERRRRADKMVLALQSDEGPGRSTSIEERERMPIDKGDTAWVLVCTALVLLMTAPGLALFYGGMVR